MGSNIGNWEIGKKKVVYNKRFRVVEYAVKKPSGKTDVYNQVESPDACVVLALTEDKETVVIKQFRPTFGKIMTGLPAGWIEEGETPAECAKRELKEETGYSANHWEYLGEFAVAPGLQTTKFHIFFARGLQEGEPQPDEGEFLEVVKLPVEQALKDAKKGLYDYSSFVLALLLARHGGLI